MGGGDCLPSGNQSAPLPAYTITKKNILVVRTISESEPSTCMTHSTHDQHQKMSETVDC